MVMNRVWDVLSLQDPLNRLRKQDLFLHSSIFNLAYVKYHVKILQKIYKEDHYAVHNLTWSGVYIKITF